jgi:hypothetical protein
VDEWGLLLLAAALAWIVYDNVRRLVVNELIVDERVSLQVRVEDRYRDRVAAVITANEKATLQIESSRREKIEEVEPRLREDGYTIDLVITGVPSGEIEPLRTNPLARYDWPFSKARLDPQLDPEPNGFIFQIERRDVGVDLPETVPSREELRTQHGLEVDVRSSRASVDVLLPKVSPSGQRLTPDPIDLGPLLASNALVYNTELPDPFELRWSAWREAPVQAWEKIYRRGLKIPEVRATIVLREVGEMRIENDVVVLLPGEEYLYEYPKQDVGVNPSGRPRLKGLLRGRLDVLQRLEEDAQSGTPNWVWGIRITDPDKLPPKPEPGEEAKETKVSAEVVFLAGELFRDGGVRFEPEPPQDGFDVRVRRAPEPR